MPASHRPVTAAVRTAPEAIDLGLQIPSGFDLQPLVPGDRLLRLHPNWFISDFQQQGESFSATIRDYVTEEQAVFTGTLQYNAQTDEILRINLTGPLEISICFLNRDNRLKVRIVSPEGEIDPDDPVLLWIRAIREYIRIYCRWTPVTLFFRPVMNRMVLQMNPSQRKISLMIAKITFVEILVILFLVVGYVVFVL